MLEKSISANFNRLYNAKYGYWLASWYSITNLGQDGLFRSQHSRCLVVSSVVVQVGVFLVDDILEVV
jgi:hypothetical protein